MSGNTTYMYNIEVEGAAAMATLNKVTTAASGASGMFKSLFNNIKRVGECAFEFNNVQQRLQQLSSKLETSIAPGVALISSMADLAAVTGEAGESLRRIEGYARKTAKTFGGSAAQSVDSYKLILSQLSPELAKTPEALAAMGESIAVISKMIGGDTTAATEVWTAVMNQFQVSLEDPMKAARKMAQMMNIMTAGAKEGSAALPQIITALEQSGIAAKAAGVSFAETIASIGALSKAGKKGSEGGVALRNVMATLSQGHFLPKDVQEELMSAGMEIETLTDKTLSLAQRLKPLQDVMDVTTLITKLFGKENSNAAIALISGLDKVVKYTTAITGTHTAIGQANTIMDSFAKCMSRQKAFVDNLKITLFNFTEAIMPYVSAVDTFFQGTASVMTGINDLVCYSESAWMKAIKVRTKALLKGNTAVMTSAGATTGYGVATGAATGATYGFSGAIRALSKAIYAIPIVGWIVAGITLLVAAFKILWDKCEGFRQGIFAVWEVVKTVFYNIGAVIKSVWENIIQPVFNIWWEQVNAVANGIWSAMKWCWDGIIYGINSVGNFFVWLWDGIMSGVSGVCEFFTGVWNWLQESCGGVINWIINAFMKITEPIRNVFSSVWDFFKQIFEKIKGVLNKFFGWISKMWNKLFPKDQFKDLGEAAEDGLKKGSESWRKSQEQKKESPVFQIPMDDEDKGFDIVSNTFKTTTKPQKTKIDIKETVDLNNIKGSTDYAAIGAKLTPVTISGLANLSSGAPGTRNATQTANVARKFNPATQEYKEQRADYLKEICLNVRKIAAGVAMFAGMSTTTPATAVMATPVAMMASAPTEPAILVPDYNLLSGLPQEKPADSHANAYHLPGAITRPQNTFGKFCDQVVINVPEGTSKDQAEYILREVMNRLNNAFNGD